MTSLLAFSLLVLLLGALCLVPGRLPRTRLLAVILAPLAVLLVWRSVHAYEGWPVSVSQPPSGTVFVAASVDEPHAIYLWLSSPTSARPRAYRIPYSDQAYAQVLQAQQARKRGQAVTVQKRKGRRGHGHGSGQQVPSWEIKRYRLPVPHPPAKDR